MLVLEGLGMTVKGAFRRDHRRSPTEDGKIYRHDPSEGNRAAGVFLSACGTMSDSQTETRLHPRSAPRL